MKPTDILTTTLNLGYTESIPAIDTEEFRNVVTSRRSVRVFDGTPIPPEVVNECLDLALLSPNSSNLQPWEFYWVRSNEKKAKLAEFCLSQSAAKTAAELIVCVARTKTWRQNAKHMLKMFERAQREVPESAVSYYKRIVPFVYGQGILGSWGIVKKLLFAIRGIFVPTPREPTSNAQMRTWAAKTVALAAQTMMLAFRAHGFDTCPMEGLDSKRVKRLLGLPRDADVVMIIAAGKRAENGVYGPRIRFDRDQFVKEV